MKDQIILTAFKDGIKQGEIDITDSPIRYLEVMLKFQEMLGRTWSIRRVANENPN